MALWEELRRLGDGLAVFEPLGRMLMATNQRLDRLGDLLARTGPLLEDLKGLDPIAEQLKRVADGLEAVRRLGEDAVGDKLVISSNGSFHVKRKKGQGKRPAGPQPPEPPAAA
jgi:hypothetical protein